MSVDPRFDDMLFGILNNVGTIEKFMDIVFSFLYRRTDFFKVKSSSSDKLGLPPGVAQKIVKVLSQRYVQLERARTPSTASESEPAKVREEKAVESDKKMPSEEKEDKNNNASSSGVDQADLCEAESKPVEAEPKPVEASNEEEERGYYTSDPESYNGASYDTYAWSQNNSELDVQVKVPDDVKSGAQVKIHVEKIHLKVEALHDENWQTLLDGALIYEVKPGSLTWTLHPRDHVHINLEKGYPRYWEALLDGEPKLNVRTIDCSIPFEDVDEEAQAKLQQMMFDQHQKRLGKPTSEEMKVQEMLKQAWDKKGSPFRGQKYDPSVLRINQ